MLPLPLVLFAIWCAVYFSRHPEPDRRAHFVRTFAFVLMMITGGFFALFVAAETMDHPGGWAGLGLVAVWAAPLAALAVLGWRWPERAEPVFEGLTAAAMLMMLWFVLDRDRWVSFEDSNGPVRTIALFATMLALTFFAWRRPWRGGSLMLALSLVPMLVSARSPGFSAMIVVNSTTMLVAALFLWSAWLEGQRPRHRAIRPHPIPR